MLKKPNKKPKSNPGWMFSEIDRPSYTDKIRFPDDLTALHSVDLGRYHGRYVGLHVYASSELAKINVEELRIESEISQKRSHRFLSLAAQQVPKWQLEIQLEANIHIQELRRRLLEVKVKKERVLSYMLNFERYANALSREMSRRAAEARMS
jgi:hypothetical protein